MFERVGVLKFVAVAIFVMGWASTEDKGGGGPHGTTLPTLLPGSVGPIVPEVSSAPLPTLTGGRWLEGPRTASTKEL